MLANTVHSQLDCPRMSPTAVETWLNNPFVARAACKTGWRATGDTVALLEEVLRQVDCPPAPPLIDEATHRMLLDSGIDIAYDDGQELLARQDTGRMNLGNTIKIILAMMDCGAGAEHLKAAGFPGPIVDRCAGLWKPWRSTVLGLARDGATPNEIRASVPSKIEWRMIVKMLELHDIEMGKPTGGPGSRVKPEVRALHVRIIKDAIGTDMSYSQVGQLHGVKKDRVADLVHCYRNGGYPEVHVLS